MAITKTFFKLTCSSPIASASSVNVRVVVAHPLAEERVACSARDIDARALVTLIPIGVGATALGSVEGRDGVLLLAIRGGGGGRGTGAGHTASPLRPRPSCASTPHIEPDPHNDPYTLNLFTHH